VSLGAGLTVLAAVAAEGAASIMVQPVGVERDGIIVTAPRWQWWFARRRLIAELDRVIA
jgi:hypothetical protein